MRVLEPRWTAAFDRLHARPTAVGKDEVPVDGWPGGTEDRRQKRAFCVLAVSSPHSGVRDHPHTSPRANRSPASPFPNAPPPPAPRRPLAHPTRVGKSATFELPVDPLHQAAQIRSGPSGQMPQGQFQVISGVLDLDAGTLGRASQIASRLPESPLETAESNSNCVRPQVFGLNTSHRCPSSSRHTRNSTDRRVLGWPPPLGAEGLGAPTRHRPFGSESWRHSVTTRVLGNGPTASLACTTSASPADRAADCQDRRHDGDPETDGLQLLSQSRPGIRVQAVMGADAGEFGAVVSQGHDDGTGSAADVGGRPNSDEPALLGFSIRRPPMST